MDDPRALDSVASSSAATGESPAGPSRQPPIDDRSSGVAMSCPEESIGVALDCHEDSNNVSTNYFSAGPTVEFTGVPPPRVPNDASSSTSLDNSTDTTTSASATTVGNDVFLSLKHPTYKSVMHEHFKKLAAGSTKDDEVNVAMDAYRFFKGEGGGNFYKLQSRTTGDYVEVDDDAAFASELYTYLRLFIACYF